MSPQIIVLLASIALSVFVTHSFDAARFNAKLAKQENEALTMLRQAAEAHGRAIVENDKLVDGLNEETDHAKASIDEAYDANRRLAGRLDGLRATCRASSQSRVSAVAANPKGRAGVHPVRGLLTGGNTDIAGFLALVAREGDKSDNVAAICQQYIARLHADYSKRTAH